MLLDAFVVDDEENFKAVEIHRPIAFAAVEGPSEISDEIMPTQIDEVTEIDLAANNTSNVVDRVLIEEKDFSRLPVPTAVQIRTAQQKMRGVFSKQLSAAKAVTAKQKLAQEFLSLAAEMESDPAGAYVLQEAALRIAIESGDAALLIDGIDSRVAQFEVDSLVENLKWYQQFAEETASKSDRLIDGMPLVKRGSANRLNVHSRR